VNIPSSFANAGEKLESRTANVKIKDEKMFIFNRIVFRYLPVCNKNKDFVYKKIDNYFLSFFEQKKKRAKISSLL
jgi:hypothetical protein